MNRLVDLFQKLDCNWISLQTFGSERYVVYDSTTDNFSARVKCADATSQSDEFSFETHSSQAGYGVVAKKMGEGKMGTRRG